MKQGDVQKGMPAVLYTNTKANIEALAGVAEGANAYATDTDEFGSYDGATWTWGQGGGSGDVVGPAGATNNHVALFDGATGKLIKDGGAAGSGDVVGPTGATNGNLAVYNGATGKLIKDGGVVPSIPAFVGARYSTNAGQSINDSLATIVDFEDVVYDTDGAVTTGASWKFTCPVGKGGYYLIDCMIMFASNAWTSGKVIELTIYKGGVLYSDISRETWQSSTTLYRDAKGSDVILLAAGEYIDIRVYQNSGGALDLYTNGTYNHVAISKIG